MATAPVSHIDVRRHEGLDALQRVASALRRAGLLPAPVVEMDPAYLSEGFEETPGTVVAYRGDWPVAFMSYALRRTRFRVAVGPAAFGRFSCRQLIVFGYAGHAANHAAVLDQLFSSLAETDTWDVIQTFQLPGDHPLATYLAGNPLGSGRRHRPVCRTFDTIQVNLEPSFEDYLDRQFTRKTRYNLKREVRLLERAAAGEVAVTIGTSAADVPRFLRDAEGIARKTYQWKLGFGTVRATPFETRRLAYLANRGHWRGYVLFIRGVPAAYCHATVRWGALSYDAVGYDPYFAPLNPGKVLLYEILEDLHEWRGVARLEFGRGAAEYKRLFANSRAVDLDATLYRYTWYGQMLRALATAADAGYYRMRPLIRPCMPYVKRLFRGGSALGDLVTR